MHQSGRDQMGAVFGIEAVKVGGVLEVVGIQSAVFQSGVGKNIVIVDHDFQFVAGFLQSRLGSFQDLSVGSGAGAHNDGLGFSGFGGFGGLGGAAGGQSQNENECEDEGNDLFHGLYLLFK